MHLLTLAQKEVPSECEDSKGSADPDDEADDCEKMRR